MHRRAFLIGTAVALLAPARLANAVGAIGSVGAFISACRRADGAYGLVILNRDGRIVREIPLSARGHDIAVDPSGRTAVAFARQPGRFAVTFDPGGAREPTLFTPPENRTFFGHGVFSPDGRLLYATENDLDSGQGKLGIYDATGEFKRIGELETFGIGPHEAVLLADGRTFAIANGGYETLPETGRTSIDIADMKPSLAFVDRLTGALSALHTLPASLNALSIRHLAATPDGKVWFGAQWEGSAQSPPELIGSASRDAPISLVKPDQPMGSVLKGYIGSVAISRDGTTIAASAPRAGSVVFLDANSGTIRGTTSLADGCGIAPAAEGFVLTSGHGDVLPALSASGPRAHHVEIAFDNHLRALT